MGVQGASPLLEIKMELVSRQNAPVVEKMYQFLTWLIPTVEKFPRSQKFTLGDRIQTAALDVLDGLIEASYRRDRQQVLTQTNLRIEKLRFLFRLALDLRCIDMRRYEHAARNLDEIGRMVGGWIKANHAEKTPSTV